MKVSNCCGVYGTKRLHAVDNWHDQTYEQQDICPKCGEHCEYIEETDLNTINTEPKNENLCKTSTTTNSN